MERLTTSLEDGTLEKLRSLAGGERRVGQFLSEVTQWLWEHKEALQETPLHRFTLAELRFAGRIREMVGDAPAVWDDDVETVSARLVTVERRVGALERVLSQYTPEELDALNERARQSSHADAAWLMSQHAAGRITDEQLAEYKASEEGQWLSELLRERSDKVTEDAAGQSQRRS